MEFKFKSLTLKTNCTIWNYHVCVLQQYVQMCNFIPFVISVSNRTRTILLEANRSHEVEIKSFLPHPVRYISTIPVEFIRRVGYHVGLSERKFINHGPGVFLHWKRVATIGVIGGSRKRNKRFRRVLWTRGRPYLWVIKLTIDRWGNMVDTRKYRRFCNFPSNRFPQLLPSPRFIWFTQRGIV